MIVYGDHVETVIAADFLASLELRRSGIGALSPGLDRHQALVALLVELGRLTQGVADAAFEVADMDVRSEAERACLALLTDVARAVLTSWDSGFQALSPLPSISLEAPLPDRLRLKLPEGYAFYALYPEAYAEAARRLALDGPVVVIGIRSIGVSLAAMVVAALGADSFWTVRPSGHPFARALQLNQDVEAGLVSPDHSYIVVDEGPGLSGSSFGCVADWLEAHGVPRHRISFLPSHDGALGPHASDVHRARWEQARRPAISAQQLIVPEQLQRWAASLLGALEGPLEDISGGGWRAHVWSFEADWPAVDPGQERLKYRAGAAGRRWLLKFAGIGALGERKLARARLLHAAGFAPEPAGLLHGFLVERWIEGVPVAHADDALLEFAGRYFGARARLLPAREEQGASLSSLLDMARHNVGIALGGEWASRLDPWGDRLAAFGQILHRVEIDGRCERHEWLRTATGEFAKTDALDHHAAHDLIGCQDIAWDVAGFAIEFGLTIHQRDRLRAEVQAASGLRIDPELLAFSTLCYLAFRLGQRHMTAAALEGWPAERQRNLDGRGRYAGLLRHCLADPEGSVGHGGG